MIDKAYGVMPMKILAISGGIRDSDNDSICKEALLGVQEEHGEIELIRLPDLHLENCKGCKICFKDTEEREVCEIDDDLWWLKERMEAADGLLFSIPASRRGAGSLFHALIDRLDVGEKGRLPYWESEFDQDVLEGLPGETIPGKPVVFLGTGGPEFPIRLRWDCSLLAQIMRWTVIENRVFVRTKCFALETEKMGYAHMVGKALARAAMEPEQAVYIGDKGVCPHCYGRNFYLNDCAQKAVCCTCGMEGRLEVEGGKVRFHFDEDQLDRAYDTRAGMAYYAREAKNYQMIASKMKDSYKYRQRQKFYQNFIEGLLPENSK